MHESSDSSSSSELLEPETLSPSRSSFDWCSKNLQDKNADLLLTPLWIVACWGLVVPFAELWTSCRAAETWGRMLLLDFEPFLLRAGPCSCWGLGVFAGICLCWGLSMICLPDLQPVLLWAGPGIFWGLGVFAVLWPCRGLGVSWITRFFRRATIGGLLKLSCSVACNFFLGTGGEEDVSDICVCYTVWDAGWPCIKVNKLLTGKQWDSIGSERGRT